MTHGEATYGYDMTGRLTSATVGRRVGIAVASHTLTYGFGALGASCTGVPGVDVDAGKTGNRTSSTDTFNGVTTTTESCYDTADRLLKATTSQGGVAASTLTTAYDTRGNTTTLADTAAGGQALAYDSANRHTTTSTTPTSGTGVEVGYSRDATDRIVARTASAQPGEPVS